MSSLGDMRRLLCGFSITVATSVVAELGIADHLAKGPKSAAELARLSGADEGFLRRVLRFLASEGVFAERDRDVFALTALSEWLRSDVADSLRPRAVFAGSKMNWAAWGSLPSSVKTGRSGMEAAFGETVFDHVRSHTEAAATFNSFMAGQTAASVADLLGAYSFEGVRQIVGGGGGHGALVAGVLRACLEMRGVLFDMPEVVAKARPLLENAGVAGRTEVVGGDFFAALPTDADLYALKFILHDWRDADCTRILKNCRAAMAPGGRRSLLQKSPHPPCLRVRKTSRGTTQASNAIAQPLAAVQAIGARFYFSTHFRGQSRFSRESPRFKPVPVPARPRGSPAITKAWR